MRKRLPYQRFELAAIEEWLNGLGREGLQITEISWPFVKFRQGGGRIYYRVRYIPENRDIAGSVFWGDLYVYSSRQPETLPPPAAREDYVAAARPYTTPAGMMLWIAGWTGTVSVLSKQLPYFAGWTDWKEPLGFALAVGLLLATVFWRIGQMNRASRYLGQEFPETVRMKPMQPWRYPLIFLLSAGLTVLIWLLLRQIG